MDFLFLKSQGTRPKRHSDFASFAKPPGAAKPTGGHPVSRLSSFKNGRAQTALSSKNASFIGGDHAASPHVPSFNFIKTKSTVRPSHHPQIDQLRSQVAALKSTVLRKIYAKEVESVAQIKQFIASVVAEAEQLEVSVISSVTSFTQILCANFKTSFEEMDLELDSLEREAGRPHREAEGADLADQKIASLQAKLGSYAFDVTVFPAVEIEESAMETLRQFLRLSFPQKNPLAPGDENNLFLESVHDPFMGEEMRRQSEGMEPVGRSVRTEAKPDRTRDREAGRGSERIERLEPRLLSVQSNKNGLRQSRIERKTAEMSKGTLGNRTSGVKVNSRSSLHPDSPGRISRTPKPPESAEVLSSLRESRQEPLRARAVEGSPQLKHRSPSFTKPPKMPADYSNLKIVDYSKRRIDEGEVIKLLGALEPGNEGFYLDLSQNNISDPGLKLVLRKLVDFPVVFMNLDDNQLGDDAVAFILSFVNYNKALQGVSIKGNGRVNVTDQKFVARRRLLEEKNLQILY